MATGDLTAQQLRELFHYDPATGDFTCLQTMGSRRRAGDVIGHAHCKGYTAVSIFGKHYLAHRLAWLYMTGLWPTEQIDHIDGVRSNNKWANLREASNSLNSQNLRDGHRDGTSGLLGVSYSAVNSKRNPWVAQIGAPGKRRIWLGSFPTKEAAHAAYLEAKRKIHAGCTI